MAKAGRKRKQGPRTPTGRLSRANAVPAFDRGTERTMIVQALYGANGSDAIGRAYQSQLLGEGSEAKALLDTARRIANCYWVAYSTGTYRCPLGDRTHGNVTDMDCEKIKRREEWLNACLATVERMGLRSQFDALVINVHPDSGPVFLDNIIYAKRIGKEPQPLDHQRLSLAIKALSALV